MAAGDDEPEAPVATPVNDEVVAVVDGVSGLADLALHAGGLLTTDVAAIGSATFRGSLEVA